MPRYSDELKASVLKRMMPPQSLSVAEAAALLVLAKKYRGLVIPGEDE